MVTDGNDTPVLLNTQYGPRYVMYYGDSDPAKGRFIAYSTDMLHWTNNTAFNMNFPADYDPWEICVAVTELPDRRRTARSNNNIVMFVAGTLMAHGRWYYGISEVEFSGDQPHPAVGAAHRGGAEPSEPYEINGRTANTVFMNSILFHNGQWYMYYGAADTVIGLATAPLRSSAADAVHRHRLRDRQAAIRTGPTEVDNGGGQSGGISNVNPYPGYGLTSPESSMRQETAHSGTTALMYSGDAAGAATDYAYMQGLRHLGPSPDHRRQYHALLLDLSAELVQQHLRRARHGLQRRHRAAQPRRADQNGNQLHPAHQCGHLTLNQWNQVTSKIGAVAAGKTAERIDLGYDQPGGNGTYRGYVDDICLTG